MLDKEVVELAFWKDELTKIMAWFHGEVDSLWGVPKPVAIIEGGTEVESMTLTWVHATKSYYLRHLCVAPYAFAGDLVVDIGCGPFPNALCFSDCMILGVDALTDEYAELGYVIKVRQHRFFPLAVKAESLPFARRSVDTVISVNAIDHVDDFETAVREICRVVKPDGCLLIETHYHPPQRCEPHVLNDERVRTAFLKTMGVVKVSEVPHDSGNGVLALWTNYPTLVKK